ncbi:MAG: protein translocase subunit SecF [Anaerovorax sp.]
MLKFKKEFSFIKYRKIYYIVTLIVVVLGLSVGAVRGFNFGIDFTGGTMLQMDMGREVAVEDVNKVLKDNHITADIGHAGKTNNEIIIKTTQALDSKQRIALQNEMFETFNVDKTSILTFELFGPSVGDLLKKNAIKAVLIASLCMLVYIVVRFEWKFGVASMAGVFHDMIILIAFYGLFHIPINNPFIAAVLTVVGYSINDTIVVFDRIRENLGIMKKTHIEELIDKSINQTLVRSLMTSLTTVLVIIPLFILGGTTIRQFTLPLMIGIVAGCASSIFICSPIYYELCKATSGGSKYKGKDSKATKKAAKTA